MEPINNPCHYSTKKSLQNCLEARWKNNINNSPLHNTNLAFSIKINHLSNISAILPRTSQDGKFSLLSLLQSHYSERRVHRSPRCHSELEEDKLEDDNSSDEGEADDEIDQVANSGNSLQH
jgi:hypothetical protein